MKKVGLTVLSIIIVSFILIGIIIVWSYKFSSDYREEKAWDNMQFENAHKSIIYENKLDSIEIGLTIYFNYSIKNSQDSLYIKSIDKEPYFSDKDTLYLEVSKYSGSYSILPIFKNDSIPFPESFNITIYEKRKYQNDTILKELDYNSFKRYAIPKNINNKNSFLKANEWTLSIDSTLLGLKDSIR